MRQRVMIAMALACEPQAADRRRADHRAGRHRSRRRSWSCSTALARAPGHGDHPDHPRPRRDRRPCRPGDRHVRRADRRDRRRPAICSPARSTRTPRRCSASIPRADQDRRQPLHAIPGLPPDLIDPPAGCRFAPRCRYATDECRAQDPPLGGPRRRHLCAASIRATSLRDARRRGRRVAPEASSAPRMWPPAPGEVAARGGGTLIKRLPRAPGASCAEPSARVQRGRRRCRSPSRAARRSGWSASPAAARRRSAGLIVGLERADRGRDRASTAPT